MPLRETVRRVAPRARTILKVLLFSTAFYLAYAYGMLFHHVSAAPFWPPDAVLLCALLLARPRRWWLYLLAPLPIRLLVAVPPDIPTWFLPAVYINDSLKAVISAALLRRLNNGPTRLTSVQELVQFFAVGVLGVPMLSAFVGAATRLAVGDSYWSAWQRWFLGDALANLLLTPMILYWVVGGVCALRCAGVKRYIEGILLMAALILVGFKALSGAIGGQGHSPVLIYLPFPLLLYAAVRFGPRGVSSALSLITAFAIWNAELGRGPFSAQAPGGDTLTLQLFLCVISVPLLCLAVLLRERQRVGESLRETTAQLARTEDFSLVMVTKASLDGRWLKVPPTLCELLGYTEEELLEGCFKDVTHPDDFEADWSQRQRLINGEIKSFGLEKRYIHKDGHTVWVDLNCSIVTDAHGRPVHFLTYVKDITETKRAELNTQFINQLDFELSQIADADEIIRLATGRLGEYLGVTSCKVIEVNPAADLAVVRESWHGWRLDGKSIVGEYRISDFTTPEFRHALDAGQAAVVNDVRTDPRTRDFAPKYESFGVGAFVTIPALNEKHWEASLNINHPHARDWRPDETQLMRDLTARLWPAFKRARAVEALRDSEERFRQLAENIGAAFFITEGFSETPPGQLRYVSPAYEKIWGRSRESLYQDSRSWLEAIHTDDIEHVLDALRSAGRAQFDEEFRITRPDGEVRWVHDRVFPIRDEDGEIYRLAGIVEDITGRKMIEGALRESEERYRSVVENQTELICRYLPDTTLTFVNESYCRYFAKTQEELIGTKFLDLIPEPAREAARKHVESLVENPRIEIDEHEVLLPDGGIGWQQWVDHAILDANGKVVEFQAVGRDITERKQVEEERREGEERLRLALEAGRMGVWEWDTRTNAVKWSKEHYTVLGLRPLSVDPDYYSWADRVHPDDLPVATEAMCRAVEEKREYRVEYRVIWPDGSVRWVEGHGKPVYDESGQCLKVNGLIVDISERKEAEEALRESEEALRKSYARIEDLAGRLIAAQEEERRHIARELHDDLNQQVAALAIGISRLRRQFPNPDAAVLEQIAKLREKTDLLSERIRQVSHELHSSILQHVGLPAALNSYCAEFSDREGITVKLDIRYDVDALPSEAALCLYRVAQESLRNIAIHSGARNAVVTLTGVNGAVELRVADQGVGFDPEHARESPGLGLVSMEERVKLLHGSFELITRPGAGTELRALIPLRRGHEQTKGVAG
ncbi:MAG TPA: PAS domain S-box protein [Blastocatellia bacterium]|nr:PAS domain S-box protein [Blastocatellia bacterium]